MTTPETQAPPTSRWDEPQSIDEATARMTALQTDIESIRAQLRVRETEPRSRRMPIEEYRALVRWQARARNAMSWKQQEYNYLKSWVKTHHVYRRAPELAATDIHDNPVALLRCARSIIRDIGKQIGHEYTDHQQLILDMMDGYVQRHA